MELKIAIFGAGGKMGCRIADNLKTAGHDLLCVEISPSGLERLKARGLPAVPHATACAQADVAILALPDAHVGRIAHEIVPLLKSGTLVIGLDPAAPYAGLYPKRSDIAYFITHPCHPPVFSEESDPEARRDFFGGIKAKQNIVCALMQGSETDYARGELLARQIYAPVMKAHRVSVEQMAILEPALAETTAATCMVIVREAMDEAIRRGVPPEAARDFLLGHINIELAIVFGEVSSPFSDGCKLVIDRARSQIFKDDWKKVFEPQNIRIECDAITQGK